MLGATLSGSAPSSPYVVSVSLPVGLQSTHGSTLTLSASSSMSVDELKALIEDVTGIGASSQGVFLGGSELSVGSQTLSGAGVSSGVSVLLSDKSVAPPVTVLVTLPAAFVPPHESIVGVAVAPGTTVGDLRCIIAHTLLGHS